MRKNTDDKEFAAFIFDDVSNQKRVKDLIRKRDRRNKGKRRINILKEKL